MRLKHLIINKFTVTLILVTCIGMLAAAQNNEVKEDQAENNQAPDTLVVNMDSEPFEFVFDETITKIGSDFFRMFYSEWENTSLITGLSIYIGEKPMPGMGTRIWVKVEDRYTYMAFVRPNLEQLRQSVKQALQQTQSYFINYELIQKDLESDDYSGTGLF
ncbi:CsgE family curli-type amyloid fiber assembly protein [Geofilum rubicundum]|uniref:Curli production assembly/transport component CsgE n=1 Tax=Geofilum rubicundum JCM 15548 TaxID=1236989 RepID=A0A0E9LZ08_9BACT|nr:CsgE family curli-type amyloid fiber assembly protein [Geofilum rubicundum]GAO30105.1 hypothetical protein JCM15548_12357 [Geofilum rubicundum JCM 15548]